MKLRRGDATAVQEHTWAWDLLPWYSTGALDDGDRRRLEAHLEACSACREEVELCRRLASTSGTGAAVAPSPHPVQFARLMARIDAYEASRVSWRTLGRGLARLVGPLRGAPPAARWALAAQLTAILALGGLLAWQVGRTAPPPPAAAYRTLSAAPAQPAALEPADVPPAAVRLRVVFAEGITEAQMRQLLLGIRAEIVGGPSPLGTYTLALPAAGGSDPVEEVIAHLRSRGSVRFVERIPGGESGG